jgi:hypothetical protein
MRGAAPGVAAEQPRRGMSQERQQRPAGLGEIQRALDRAPAAGLPRASRAIASSRKA